MTSPRPRLQSLKADEEAKNFFSALFNQVALFNTESKFCLKSFDKFFYKWKVSDVEEGKNCFQEAFDKAQQYELFSLTYHKLPGIYRRILEPEL
jgi:hypothetical protein